MNITQIHERVRIENEALKMQYRIIQIEDTMKRIINEDAKKKMTMEIIKLNAEIMKRIRKIR